MQSLLSASTQIGRPLLTLNAAGSFGLRTSCSLQLPLKYSKNIRCDSSPSRYHLLMPRKLSYSSIDKKTSPSTRAREVPSPPLPYPRSSSAVSDNSEKGSDSSSSSDDEEERQERVIKKKSLMGLFALTIAIGGAQIVASVLSASVTTSAILLTHELTS